MDRRALLRHCTGFFAFALVAELSAASSRPSSISSRKWIAAHRELAQGLQTGALSQAQWHEGVTSLARDLDLELLAAELRRARIKNAGTPFGHDPQKRFVSILDEDGRPVKLGYGLALFDFGPESVITPHAHKYMVSAHMVIEGRVRVRTFDRLQDEEHALIIRPTSDVIAEPGDSAAMTTPRDNVHWFVPRSARAMTLDVIVDGLEANQEDYLIQPLDPLGGQPLRNGAVRAPIISFERSMRLYTSAR